MDPLSIATSCLGLVSAIATISKAVNELTSELRDAKDELSRVSNELTSLQVPPRHIGNRAQASGDSVVPIAAELQTQIKKIVANCRTVVEEIGRIVDKCSTRRRGARSVGWVLVRSDVYRLRSSLESHKIALNIALSLVDSELCKAIQDDTRHIRSQVAAISSDVRRVQSDTANITAQNAHILGEIRSMRVLAPQETVTNGQILDAIQNILSRLSMEAPPESIPLQEHLEIMRELTRNQAPPDDIDPWVDWVADPKPGYSFSNPIAATRRQRHRALSQSLIVAIDYGVSFTSVAFAWSNAESLDDIQVLCNYPGNDRQSFSKQVPSVIAYARENVDLCQDVWGFLVPPGIKAYRGTKLLIDRCFTDAGDVGIDLGLDPLRIPVGKTAKDAVADYLRGLRRAIYDEICIKMGDARVSVTSISFWLTVPAIWPERAKMLLKKSRYRSWTYIKALGQHPSYTRARSRSPRGSQSGPQAA
ncbi:hypothetical protein BGZ61DRAFT_538588 [Ilyonectria robusta]|uniref:uncharacterized protein n=1 Tax=Ilyonectria robusta TaxID=1079257 RepID=UPI001E8DF856|nr:uncharacterized protein BGZ61DRAFT_538588 [Ilyonectria robusta]KAH8665625.1 hypothetical protein BGZ61DRAFT_538588 [Ilyonectria robusta]